MQTPRQSSVAAVVPVLNPEPGLVPLCRALVDVCPLVIVVDDGSDENVAAFDELPKAVVVLRHKINLGKGAAIKKAIRYLVEHHPEVQAVVFADGDGQHRVEDAVKVAEQSVATGHVTLGVRDFGKGVPFRSKFGNTCTALLVRMIYGLRISDTQTGLRAIPSRLFSEMLNLDGERYEYEMRLFGMLKDCGEPLEQVPIKTIYIDNNRASHFRPLRDSLRVYHGLFGDRFLKFAASSGVGFLADNLAFTFFVYLMSHYGIARNSAILYSLIPARILSATLNYACNRKIVFKSTEKVAASYLRYWMLAIVIAALSYCGTAALSSVLDAEGVLITIAKIVVETFLFVLSYRVQKKWVFAK